MENSTSTILSPVEFDPQLITFIENPQSRDHVLKTLSDLLYDRGKIKDGPSFYQAILEREQIVSTGIGLGVAIPHAKFDDFDEFFVAVGILPKRGVDWDAIDKTPVRVVFLIGGPSDRQAQYLQILSTITQKIKEDEVRSKLILAQSPHSVIEQLI